MITMKITLQETRELIVRLEVKMAHCAAAIKEKWPSQRQLHVYMHLFNPCHYDGCFHFIC